jgi:MoaA/NifB/PqqE/SkfB family radical SAM enzyme
MKKVLVLGNNTEDTDDQTTRLAGNYKNHGLVSDPLQDVSANGYYHTTISDLPPGDIINIAKQFDEVIMLDQTAEEWVSSKPFLTTYKIMVEIEKNSNRWATRSKYKTNANIKTLEYWTNLFKGNESFCIYPWIHFNNYSGHMQLCSRSFKKVKDVGTIKDWSTDPDYGVIRKAMLEGKRLPKSCSTCYQYQERGLDSYRVHDSLDYIVKLGLNNLKDLEKIDNPYYYEVRLSNKCNLMCRMCTPIHSHLLKREFRQNPELAIPGQNEKNDYKSFSSTDHIDIDSLTPKHSVYLTGGEPTVMREVYDFMQHCIDRERTDFELTLPTNVQSLNSKFMRLAKQFSRMHFSVSIDGYGLTNDYIRWRSDWKTIEKNLYMIKDEGIKFSWNHVPTIWGIHRTHELFEFASENFPHETLYLQYNRIDLHSAYRSPLVKETLESLERCKKTRLYWSDGKDCRSGIDSFYNHYQSYKPDKEHLKKFFDWNDKMDNARNIKMADYIPELAACNPNNI